jgi:hypothetical protein
MWCRLFEWPNLRSKFYSRGNWWRDKRVFEIMKQVIAQVGRLAEERPKDVQGYVAERPEAFRDVIRVWSPCGCCVTYMSANASVLTQCNASEHDFDWTEAELAIQALQRAEAEIKKGETGGESQKLAIVKLAKS